MIFGEFSDMSYNDWNYLKMIHIFISDSHQAVNWTNDDQIYWIHEIYK